jgi:hypothetical protein
MAGGCNMARTVEKLEPFESVVPHAETGTVYLAVDPDPADRNPAVIQVNDREWAQEVIVQRGDRVSVAYPRRADAPVIRYLVQGPTRTGYARFEAERWYHDGFPAEREALRVPAYRAQ